MSTGSARRVEILLSTRSDKEIHDITAICQSVTMYQNCDSSDGRVEMDILDIPTINPRFGDILILICDKSVVFEGKLFTIERSDDEYLRHHVFVDETFYLKNKITLPMPKPLFLWDLCAALLSKYQIEYTRIDKETILDKDRNNDSALDAYKVREMNINGQSIIDVMREACDYISYMRHKKFVLRPKGGKVELVDIEATNIHGFTNSYPLTIEYSNRETIADQTYTYFEFFKNDEVKTSSKEVKETSSEGKANDIDGLSQNDLKSNNQDFLNRGGSNPNNTKTRTVKNSSVNWVTPAIPYTEQAINREIAMFALQGDNGAVDESLLDGKPEVIKDITEKKEGYSVGSEAWLLQGEAALWGFLPFVENVPSLPVPPEIVNELINVYRNPTRGATYRMLVHNEFHLPGDKLFIGSSEDVASVFVIQGVTTKFENEDVIQDLEIFQWQKTFDKQYLVLQETLDRYKEEGKSINDIREAMREVNLDIITRESDGIESAGWYVTTTNGMSWNEYKQSTDNPVSRLQDKFDLITKDLESKIK